MVLIRLEADIAANAIIEALGFSTDVHSLTDSGGIASALRRAVTIHPAVSRTALISYVAEPMISITGEDFLSHENPLRVFRTYILDVLEDLTSIGDILEIQETDESRLIQQRTMYHPGYPSFVVRDNGDVLLLGTLPGYTSPIPQDMQDKVVHRRLLRVIPYSAEPDTERLRTFGLKEILGRTWISSPPQEEAASYLDRFNRDLDNRNLEGNLKPRAILVGENVKYYKGRWRGIKATDKGRFLGRISQPYGSPAWAYLEIEGGRVMRSRFFATPGSRYRAFEEAWRLQSAIDSVGGNPQQISTKKISETETAISIYSPLPSWLDRRWILLADKGKELGSLATYRFNTDDVDEEVEFAQKMFWVEVNKNT